MAQLAINLFGSFAVKRDGTAVTGFESDKARALLAYLAVEAGWPHRRESLAALLWSEFGEQAARANLRRVLSNVRRVLAIEPDDLLLASPQTIQFQPGEMAWVDVLAFTQLVTGGPPDVSRLEEAIKLYRGPFLDGFTLKDSEPFEDWLRLTREQLTRQMLDALSRLSSVYQREGESEKVIEVARRQLVIEPWDEAAHRQLMMALVQNGRRAEALLQYENCRQLLVDELDIEPEAATQQLARQIQENSDFLPVVVRAVIPFRHNLPPPATLLVGRTTELETLYDLLTSPTIRFVTIIGPGGVGKTRLALAVGQQFTAVEAGTTRFQDGLFFVPLAALDQADGILLALAAALNFPLSAGAEPQTQLQNYLRHKRCLLILDNCEHLAEATAVLITTLLSAAPELTILATSRESLRLHQEHILALDGLPYPEQPDAPVADYPAARLFYQAARRTRPDFIFAGKNGRHISRICQLVGGLPLGVELAASWVNVLSLPAIAENLAESLDFLATEAIDMPPRHRSLRAVFDASWQRLRPVEQTLFAGLSVFRGGFSRAAAVQVTGATLPQLASLVNKTLIRYELRTDRYDLHPLLHQYSAAKLAADTAKETAFRHAHGAYFATWLADNLALISTTWNPAGQALLAAEADNVREAWLWLVAQGQYQLWSRIIEPFHDLLMRLGFYREAERLFNTAVATLDGQTASDDPVRQYALAKVLAYHGHILGLFYKHTTGRQQLLRSLELLESPLLMDRGTYAERAFVLEWLGDTVDGIDAQRYYQKSLALARSANDLRLIASALLAVGEVTFRDKLGSFEEAQPQLAEALVLFQQVEDPYGIAWALQLLGMLTMYQGDLLASERHLQEGLVLRRRLESPFGITHSLKQLGWVHLLNGRFEESLAHLQECLAIEVGLGFHSRLVGTHYAIGLSNLYMGNYEVAQGQWTKSLHLAQETQYTTGAGMAWALLGMLALVEGKPTAAQHAFQESGTCFQTPHTLDRFVEVLLLSALAERNLGQNHAARQRCCQAIELAGKQPIYFVLLRLLPVAALLLADAGETETAVTLYTTANKMPLVSQSPWYQAVIGNPFTAATKSLSAEQRAAAIKRGEEFALVEGTAVLQTAFGRLR